MSDFIPHPPTPPDGSITCPCVVRLYDGMDHDWIDVTGPLPYEEAYKVWLHKTKNGTEATKFDHIDYYRIFPAGTRMLYSEGFGELCTHVPTLPDADPTLCHKCGRIITAEPGSPWRLATASEFIFSILRNPMGRWVIINSQQPGLAWSGARWVPHDNGLPEINPEGVQLSSFPTPDEAQRYARERFPLIAPNTLEVGTNGNGEVVINHPDLKPDENGVGHIIFSTAQARNLARLLLQKADDAEEELRK